MQLARRARWAVVALALGIAPAAAPAADPKLLPKGTEVVISVNLQQILQSEAAKANKELVDQAKFLVESGLADKGVAKHLERAGFDLFRDLHRITFASPGRNKPQEGLLLVEGNFNAAKIQAAAEDAAKDKGETLKVVKAGKYQVFLISPPEKDEKAYVTIVGNKLLVAAGDKAAFDGALARLDGTQAPELSKEFKALMETTGEKQSFSIAATGPALSRLLENAPVPNAETAAASLQAVDALSLAITITRDITFQLGVNAKDKEAAEQISKAANGGLVLVRSMVAKKAKEDEKLAPVLDVVKTLRVTSVGPNVTVRGEITFENLGKLLKNLPQQGGQ